MDQLTEIEIENLLREERRKLRLPVGATVEVVATRHHWLVVEECRGYGWSPDEIARLAFLESRETGREFGECFCYVLAHIQADGRHVLGPTDDAKALVPLLPNDYHPREVPPKA